MSRFLTLLLFVALFNACISDEQLLVSEPAPDTETEPAVNIFAMTDGTAEFTHGYVYTSPAENGVLFRHHIVLTTEPVDDGGTLTGMSAALAVVLITDSQQPTGLHTISSRSSLNLEYYPNLQFSANDNTPHETLRRGTIAVTEDEGAYELKLDYRNGSTTNPLHQVMGTYRGELVPVSPRVGPADLGEMFQGPNHWEVANSQAGPSVFNHAYLIKHDDLQELYLTVDELPVSNGKPQGTTTMQIISLNDSDASIFGKYLKGGRAVGDFLTPDTDLSLVANNYCSEYNFQTNSFRTDDDTDVETIIDYDGTELRVRLRGQNRYGQEVDGLYRGPLTVID